MTTELTTIESNLPAINVELVADYDNTAEGIEKLITMGTTGLEAALSLLESTEASPRTVESFSLLLKTVSELNMKYLEIKRGKSDIGIPSDKSTKGEAPKVVQNTQYVFNGSTDELGKMVADITASKKKK